MFSVLQLADEVCTAARHLGYDATVEHFANPRVEAEEHYYNPVNRNLLDLGLEPRLLSEELIETMLHSIERYKDRVVLESIDPVTKWR